MEGLCSAEREKIKSVLHEIYRGLLPIIVGEEETEIIPFLAMRRMCVPTRELMAIEILKKMPLSVWKCKGFIHEANGFKDSRRQAVVIEHGALIVGPFSDGKFNVVDPAIQGALNYCDHKGLFISPPLEWDKIVDFLDDHYESPLHWAIAEEPFFFDPPEEAEIKAQMTEKIACQKKLNQESWARLKERYPDTNDPSLLSIYTLSMELAGEGERTR